jgi:hypothetical protein
MKIEIGENLTASYLRHVKSCRIVQTNWKTSSQWKITEYEEKKSRELFEKIKSSPFFSQVFKNNRYDQLIKQAEIDVIGLNTTEKSAFGIDVAFHNAGLNYKDTTNTVLKKIFRTLFVLLTYFSDFDKFNAYFITPKANPAIEESIRELIRKANELIDDKMISVEIICNEEFFSSIVDPIIEKIDDDNDTSELFIRSIKLLQLGKRDNSITNSKKTIKKPTTVIDKTTVDGMKIGQFVQYNMKKLFEQNLVSQDEINNLQNKEYSKSVFDQNYEVLRSFDKEITSADGRNRYYTNEKFFGGYYLTSQWVERHWEPIKDWLKKMNNQ